MTVTPKPLCQGISINIADTTLYTCPANTRAIVTAGTFVNTDVGAHLLYIHVSRSGGSPDDYLINGRAMAAGADYVSPQLVNQVLEAGDQIMGNADTDADITAIISGFEIVG